MLLRILLGLAVVIVLLLVVVALQPARFQVTRSATIAAPADVVFEQVNVLRNWEPWNPWLKLDADAKTTYEGPEQGEGAVCRWSGNKDVGKGSMTITESSAEKRVALRLDFLEPFKSTGYANFTFQPEGQETIVTWTMEGEKNFMAKAMHLVINMDKMIGGQFEQGLAALNTAAVAHATK